MLNCSRLLVEKIYRVEHTDNFETQNTGKPLKTEIQNFKGLFDYRITVKNLY